MIKAISREREKLRALHRQAEAKANAAAPHGLMTAEDLMNVFNELMRMIYEAAYGPWTPPTAQET